MTKRLTMLVAVLTIFGCMAFSATTVVGVVSDSNCNAKHSHASAAAAECVKKCVASGAKYVLVSHGKVYQVSPQDKFADYAGHQVRVRGTVNGDSIEAESVEPTHMGHHHHHHASGNPSGGE